MERRDVNQTKHHGVDDVRVPDQAPVEEAQPGRHQEHQSGGRQHPGCGACIHRGCRKVRHGKRGKTRQRSSLGKGGLQPTKRNPTHPARPIC